MASTAVKCYNINCIHTFPMQHLQEISPTTLVKEEITINNDVPQHLLKPLIYQQMTPQTLHRDKHRHRLTTCWHRDRDRFKSLLLPIYLKL